MELAACLTEVSRGILLILIQGIGWIMKSWSENWQCDSSPKTWWESQICIRCRMRNESISELMQDTSQLTRKAFPSAYEEIRDYMFVSSFFSVLGNEQELFVYQWYPKMLEEAGRDAMSYEIFKLGRPRPDLQVGVQKVTNNSEKQWTVGVETKLDQVLGRFEMTGKVKRDIP